jgi:hypothetical protein
MRTLCAAIAATTVLLTAACTPGPGNQAPSTPISSAPMTNTIAWLDSPAAIPTEPAPTPPPIERPCTAADLPATTTFEYSPGISQSMGFTIYVQNVGPSACTVTGDPVLYSADAQGHEQVVPVTRSDWADGPATIAPGERARLLVIFRHSCEGALDQYQYRSIEVVQSGRRISVPGLSASGSCPAVDLGRWLLPLPPPGPAPTLRYGSLVPLLDVPATVSAGATLDYVVTLNNPTPAAITLRPCPVYREQVFKQVDTYLLNCDAPGAGTVPAGGSLRFAMRATVSAYTPQGGQRLTWTILEPDGTSATASANIVVA